MALDTFYPAQRAANQSVPPCIERNPNDVADPAERLAVAILLQEFSRFQTFLRIIRLDHVWCVELMSSGVLALRSGRIFLTPEHDIVRLGSKPFLVVTSQGISGSGVSSPNEPSSEWMAPSQRRIPN